MGISCDPRTLSRNIKLLNEYGYEIMSRQVCKILSCSSDDLLYGNSENSDAWTETADKLRHLDIKYIPSVEKIIQGILEAIAQTP